MLSIFSHSPFTFLLYLSHCSRQCEADARSRTLSISDSPVYFTHCSGDTHGEHLQVLLIVRVVHGNCKSLLTRSDVQSAYLDSTRLDAECGHQMMAAIWRSHPRSKKFKKGSCAFADRRRSCRPPAARSRRANFTSRISCFVHELCRTPFVRYEAESGILYDDPSLRKMESRFVARARAGVSPSKPARGERSSGYFGGFGLISGSESAEHRS